MKKTFFLIIIASILLACDKTENEEGILDTFFGESKSNTLSRPNSYDQMQPSANVYLQEFDSAETSDWPDKNDENAQHANENGELIIRGKKSHYTWKNLTGLNQSSDFQIEIRIQFNFVSVTSTEAYMGIVWGINDDKKTFNYLSLFNNANQTMQIGNYDGEKYNNRYAQPSNLTKNAHHIYTIRKVGSNIYIFANKRYICEFSYTSFPSNYGFWLTTNGIVSVDYVRVDYIN